MMMRTAISMTTMSHSATASRIISDSALAFSEKLNPPVMSRGIFYLGGYRPQFFFDLLNTGIKSQRIVDTFDSNRLKKVHEIGGMMFGTSRGCVNESKLDPGQR
jgi:hypothetical protein